MLPDPRKSSGLHSWCKECKRESTNARYRRERGKIPDARRTASGKPKWKPTALFQATPRKPRTERTDKEAARYRKVLLDPERRKQVKMMRENRTNYG